MFAVDPIVRRDPPHRGILIVEDKSSDAELLTRELFTLNLGPVMVLSTIKEVNEFIDGLGRFEDREQFPLPAVLILDIALPDGDARDYLVDWRKKLGRNTLLILTTGAFRPEELQDLYTRGADTLLMKPITSGDLEHLTVFYHRFFPAESIAVTASAPNSRI